MSPGARRQRLGPGPGGPRPTAVPGPREGSGPARAETPQGGSGRRSRREPAPREGDAPWRSAARTELPFRLASVRTKRNLRASQACASDREGKTMTGTCLCGAVSVTIDAPPDFIHDCNCNLCRKSGGAWGYFSSSQVRADGSTSSVIAQRQGRPRRRGPFVPGLFHDHAFHDGQVIHGQARPDRHGWRQHGLVQPWRAGRRRSPVPKGSGWSGDGAFDYRRPPVVIGGDAIWKGRLRRRHDRG